ncbi:MAG: hypothetical protein JW941_04995, partial [Candidatus Coatesbacteria bacterium]|nr:hypothetical protein [Candidatus Coatesbacteria bacterium]
MAKESKKARSGGQQIDRRMTIYQLFRERVFKEAIAVLVIVVAVTSLVSLWGGNSEDNPVGLVGRWIYGAFGLLFGHIPSYLLLVPLFAFSLATLFRRKPRLLPLKIIATFTFTIALGTIYALFKGHASMQEAFLARKFAEILIDYTSAVWAVVLAAAILLASAIIVAGVSLGQMLSLVIR